MSLKRKDTPAFDLPMPDISNSVAYLMSKLDLGPEKEGEFRIVQIDKDTFLVQISYCETVLDTGFWAFISGREKNFVNKLKWVYVPGALSKFKRFESLEDAKRYIDEQIELRNDYPRYTYIK